MTPPAPKFPEISGYTIAEQVYLGSRTAVYLAIQDSHKLPVVIKVLRREYPSFGELVQFRNQYTISKNLPIAGIVQPLSLETFGNGYALVMADWGGISLETYIEQKSLDLTETLEIAIQLAEILHELHQHRVIHKDIKPANILINPESKQVKLIDFSIASLLPKETQEIQNPNVLEGTLAYLAPEQTGRMNRAIDYRADFYALGVTFYKLLSGQLPFVSDEPMELVHCHIAKTPKPINQVNPSVPFVVAAIVAKLMAKNAEDRYQSALGLRYDLQYFLSQWKETGSITEFQLGQRDLCDRFLIPEKLYGREQEVQTLLDAFERVSQGASEMMLVAGFSGIGKTAVVNEVHKPITRQKGYFIKGKFDQFNRNIPLSAFVQALRDLMGQLLAESNSQIQEWKSKILEAIGESGQVIVDVIPELEHIIGQQPPVSEVSGTAAQNRFNLLFQKFVQVFTNKEHPLVIFLDDLQWADSASLKLIQLLMGEVETRYLLLLGAYRDNEVFPAHPLVVTLDNITKAGTVVNTITLQPLSQNSLNSLVGDVLKCSNDLVQKLTQLIYQKTQGNPFFCTQFLKALYEEELIVFDLDAGYWQCDITNVRQMALTDDVVEFMALQLQKLPQTTQNILKLAACIGNQFDLVTLAIISECSEMETATALWKALQEGFILPQSEIYKFYLDIEQKGRRQEASQGVNYKFLHDRVQQAAYSLIPEEQKQFTHLKIGKLLLQSLSVQEQQERIFDLVNQLNLGKAVISNIQEQQELAWLNLQAGQKAKLSAAYQAAESYCTIGISLLPIDTWQIDYNLIYNLHRYASEAAYLCGNFQKAETLYKETLNYAQTPLDQAVIYRVQMTQYQLQGRNSEAIDIQRQSLQLLGWEMPTEPEQIQASLDAEIVAVNRFLAQHTVASILSFPKMENERIAEMLRILQILFYAAWLDGQPTLALLAIAKMTTFSLQHGNSDMSPFGYVGYGLIANTMLKEFATAYQFGDMAVQLCEQFDNADVRGMTNFLFAADVHSWSRPIREADTYYDNAYKYGMEAGNWLTVGFMMMQSGSDRLTYGKNLEELYAIAQTHADFLRYIKSLENLDALIVGVIQPIRNLLGLTKTPFSFDDDSFSESEYLEKYSHAPYHLAWLYSVKIRHAYLFNDRTKYPDLISKLSIIENTISSHAKVPSSVFYVALMHITLAENAGDETEIKFHLQAAAFLEEKLHSWQTACPENIIHKSLLIKAEKARLNRENSEAIEFYEQAITAAQTNEYGYEEALANELTAKFYLNWGKEKAASGYMQEAYYCYAKWGAKAKTDDLEKRYPQLLKPVSEQRQVNLNPWETISTTTFSQTSLSIHSSSATSKSISDTLDFTSILKAAQAISSSIELDELVTSLTKIILENSGAKKSVLILPEEDTWQVRGITFINHQDNSQSPIQTNFDATLLDTCEDIPRKLINYVKNTQEAVVINDCQTNISGVIGEYMLEHQPKSVLCTPIIRQGNLAGILYLENQLTSGVFTSERLQVINLLSSQAAISIENARLYQQSQDYSHQLEQSIQVLQSAQNKLCEDEQMMRKQAQALVQLSESQAISQGHLEEAFCELTTVTSELLQVERVSIWLFDEFQTQIQCVDLFQRSCESHSKDFILKVDDYPAYFSAVMAQAILSVDDTWADPRTAEFKKGYLDVLNIVSMLDSRIHLNGVVSGIICCEQVGEKRIWSQAEQNFIRSIANLIALTLESNQRHQKAEKLKEALLNLAQSQLQIVQSEKMSALGNLVAGVAHEMNNPLGFISATLQQTKPTFAEISEHLQLCHKKITDAEILDHAEEINLDYSLEDFPKMLDAMTMACERLQNISTSLRTFSRADKDYKVKFNIHEGIDSTILILKHRLKANEQRPAIEVITNYGDLPQIDCFPGQLNQVFMNILANAIDALDESNSGRNFEEIKANPNIITVTTSMETIEEKKQVKISIFDNGKGMSEEVQQKIFDHLFTTKGVGKGTGLGLAIARQIIVEKHGGSLDVQSELGQGTEFYIRLPIEPKSQIQ